MPALRVTWRDETRRGAAFEGGGKLEGRAEVEVEVEREGDVLEGQGECRDDEDDADDKDDLACMPLALSQAAKLAAASSWRTALAESPP